MEIRRLRRLLAGEVRLVVPSDAGDEHTVQPAVQTQARLLQQLLLAGSPNMVARRISQEDETGDKEKRGGYRTGAMEQIVFIHNSSVLKQARPEWVVYQDLVETRGKIVMRGVPAAPFLIATNTGRSTSISLISW